MAVADAIIEDSSDPAARRVRVKESPASLDDLRRTLLSRPDLYGYFGKDDRR